MVAKSFQSMTQLCEPYKKNGRMYVKVKNEKTGNEREVRWYTEFEYAKMYPETESLIKHTRSQKFTLGFDEGYVYIFKGDTYANLEWFQESIARYCRLWGWYIRSVDQLPADLPVGIEPIKLFWDDIGDDTGWLLDDQKIINHVQTLLFEESKSQYQGEVGERLERTLTVKKAIPGENRYGKYTTHIMTDADENEYMWVTSAKTWGVGEVYNLKGTVKSHAMYKNSKVTILTRCALIK